MRNRAFTLIELLVVIAIIAILAAILFPVFAQAKVAAKGAASLSNDKQITLAVIMYSNDVDDVAPLDCKWGDQDAYYWFGTPGSEFTPWSYIIQPYMKTGDLLQDPLASKEPTSADTPASVTFAYNPSYGYNYTVLSPITTWEVTPWPRAPIGLSSVNKPADTVMVTSKNTNAESDGWYWWGAGTLLVSPYTVEAPDCYTIKPVCMANWGSGWYSDTYMKKNRVAGAYTGFNSLRKSGQSVVSFCDGHVRSMAPANLGQGTNWNPGIADADLIVTDASKYLWGNHE